MRSGSSRVVLMILSLILCAAWLPAQQGPEPGKIITVRLLDGKTGTHVDATNVFIQFDHHKDVESSWKHQNDDGSLQVSLPPGATVIGVHATYQEGMEFYVNCDVAKQKDTSGDMWYPISDILKSGIVMPNDCVKEKDAAKIKTAPKPGEFVVYVRQRNWREVN